MERNRFCLEKKQSYIALADIYKKFAKVLYPFMY